MARPAVSSVILGARSMDQLTGNMATAELKLTPDETQLLDEASEPPTPDYPYGKPGQSQRSRHIQGREILSACPAYRRCRGFGDLRRR
jgi:aryl-alcohol dehydrogenase (NADP+)